MRARSFFALPFALSLFACGQAADDTPTDDDAGDDEVDDAPPSAQRPTPLLGPDEPGHGAMSPTPGATLGDPAAREACPRGTRYDGRGCGSWRAVATACGDFEEVMPDGVTSASRCQIAPPFGGTYRATMGGLLDLADGSQLTLRESPGATMDSTEKAETWLRAPGGAWARIGDLASIERPSDAAVLADGRVLAIGCAVRNRCSHGVAEIFDPALGAWVGGFVSPDETWLGNLTLFALPDGDALALDSGRVARLRVDKGAWELGPFADMGIDAPAVELMPDGRVLAVGGSFYGWERYAYVLDVDTLGWHRAADPGLYTFRNLAARALGGVVVFGSETNGDALAKVYTSSPPGEPM